MEDCAQGLTVARVAEKLSLRLSDLQCVFIGGSRLWGTAKPSSDYDLIVVSKEVQGKTCVHAGDGSIDAQLLGTDEYLLRIRQHRWLELITLWMPADCVVMRKLDPPKPFAVNPKLLAATVAEETSKDWSRAQKYVQRKDLLRAKRTICHTLRMNMLAAQVAEHGKVTDLTAANELHAELQYIYETSWEYYDSVYGSQLRYLAAITRGDAPAEGCVEDYSLVQPKCENCEYGAAEGKQHCCQKCKHRSGHGKKCDHVLSTSMPTEEALSRRASQQHQGPTHNGEREDTAAAVKDLHELTTLSSRQRSMGKNSSATKPAASPKKSDPPVKEEPEAVAGEVDHASGSVLDRIYPPLPAKVIWMLPHSSRCHLVAVDQQRCSWACESGALRRVFLYDTQQSLQAKIDWYKQKGLEHIELMFADNFDKPVNQLPLSISEIKFGWKFNQPVEHLPTGGQM